MGRVHPYNISLGTEIVVHSVRIWALTEKFLIAYFLTECRYDSMYDT